MYFRTVVGLLVLIMVAAGFIFLTDSDLGWISNKEAGQTATETSVNKISPVEFAEMIKSQEVFVVDVHTPEQTQIPGTDAFIPYDAIAANADQLPEDRSVSILVYCRSGSMSAQAAEELVARGYSEVYDLQGGTDSYKEQQVSVALWPETKDLGRIVYGEVAETSFTLTNYMPLPLKITRLSTSCGCTKAEAEKEVLGAYESTKVRVTFDPAVHQDDTDIGDIIRTIYLNTDNPEFNNLTASIKAVVVKE